MMSRPRIRHAVALLLGVAATGVAGAPQPLVLQSGTIVHLETAAPLSSKTSVKGDLVVLRTTDDVRIAEQIVIPRGTAATGQVTDVRAKGAMGMSGRLVVRPLFLKLGELTVRLSGEQAQVKGSVTAGAVAGMALLTPGFTGRSAAMPAGTQILGYVERTISMDAPVAR